MCIGVGKCSDMSFCVFVACSEQCQCALSNAVTNVFGVFVAHSYKCPLVLSNAVTNVFVLLRLVVTNVNVVSHML